MNHKVTACYQCKNSHADIILWSLEYGIKMTTRGFCLIKYKLEPGDQLLHPRTTVLICSIYLLVCAKLCFPGNVFYIYFMGVFEMIISIPWFFVSFLCKSTLSCNQYFIYLFIFIIITFGFSDLWDLDS